MNEHEDKMKVTILTGNYRITGVIELFQGQANSPAWLKPQSNNFMPTEFP